jgi:histidine triad (HIT) family protein
MSSGEIPVDKEYEDKDLFVINDINPQSPVHQLIIPKKHISTLLMLSQEEKELIGSVFLVAKDMANNKGIAKNGFRVVANCNRGAGQSVFHIHFHLLGGRNMGWPPG